MSMISEGLLFETMVLIAIASLLLWTLYKVSIENLPLAVKETYVFYKDKVIPLENAVLLHAEELSREYSAKIVHRISLYAALLKLKRLTKRKRDYVIIGREYKKIRHMVCERK